jgi:hypothetical protein
MGFDTARYRMRPRARGRGRSETTLALVDDDLLRSLDTHLREQADRPFGDTQAISGQTLQPFSIAGQQAAENLLSKARRALDNGDASRTRTFVDRAVRLPFDEHEDAAPAALAAQMDLYCLVTDALEVSEADDSRWLDAAEDVLGIADEAGCCELRDVLVAIDHDYSILPHEHRRIRAAIMQIPDRAELRDLKLTSAELGDHVMCVLHVHRHYRDSLERRTGWPVSPAPARSSIGEKPTRGSQRPQTRQEASAEGDMEGRFPSSRTVR